MGKKRFFTDNRVVLAGALEVERKGASRADVLDRDRRLPQPGHQVAEREGSEAVVIQLDTPGGDVNAMTPIERLLSVLVNPNVSSSGAWHSIH